MSVAKIHEIHRRCARDEATGCTVLAMTDQQISDVPSLQMAVLRDHDAVLQEALGVIDEALAKFAQRELMSAGEVADVLLDVRMILTH